MSILELDEAQGLTPKMVREYIGKLGHPLYKCPEFPVCKSLGRHTHQGSKENNFTVPDMWNTANVRRRKSACLTLEYLAALAGISEQALLREINPRLLPGLPSEQAREAHRCGLWLAQPDFDCIGAVVCIVVSLRPDEEGFSVWYPEGFEFADKKTEKSASKWKFWPCDEHGNKVRWPERDRKLI